MSFYHQGAAPRRREEDEEDEDDSEISPAEWNRQLLTALRPLSQSTTDRLRLCDREDEDYNRAQQIDLVPRTFMDETRCQKTVEADFDACGKRLVAEMPRMREGQTLPPNGVHYVAGIHWFYEMTRMHLLLHRSALLKELYLMMAKAPAQPGMLYHASFATATKHAMWVEFQDDIQDPLWAVPFLDMTLPNLEHVLLGLVRLLDSVPKAGIAEYRRVFELIWLRFAMLLTRDPQPLRCAALLFFRAAEIFRRLHLYRRVAEQGLLGVVQFDLRGLVDQLREITFNWLRASLENMAASAFDTMHADASEQGYAFAGDDRWFRWTFPTRFSSRGVCLTEFHPQMHGRFYSEHRLLRPAIMASAQAGNFVSRVFLIRLVDSLIRNADEQALSWANACVIFSEEIDHEGFRIQSHQCPLLVQFLSSFCVYSRAAVYDTDNIFEAIGVWMWLVRTQYESQLYEVDLTVFLNEILRPVLAA